MYKSSHYAVYTLNLHSGPCQIHLNKAENSKYILLTNLLWDWTWKQRENILFIILIKYIKVRNLPQKI